MSIIKAFAASLALIFASSSAFAGLLWDISGPGTTSAINNGDQSTLNYSINPAGYNTRTWTATATADADGDYTFDWNYYGSHAWYQVTAFLNVIDPATILYSAGPQNCCTTPSGSFNQSGEFTFTGVSAGDEIGFTFGGSNFDSSNFLTGTLTLTQTNVPEPASIAIFGLGLIGLAFARRRAQ